MNDFVTSLIGREVVAGSARLPIVAVVVARGGAAEGNILVYFERPDGSLDRKVFDQVKLWKLPLETPMTEKQTEGYVPRKGQIVTWVEHDWDAPGVPAVDHRGIVIDFAAIDAGGTIILTVDEIVLVKEDTKQYGVDRLSLRAGRVKTWIEPEEMS